MFMAIPTTQLFYLTEFTDQSQSKLNTCPNLFSIRWYIQFQLFDWTCKQHRTYSRTFYFRDQIARLRVCKTKPSRANRLIGHYLAVWQIGKNNAVIKTAHVQRQQKKTNCFERREVASNRGRFIASRSCEHLSFSCHYVRVVRCTRRDDPSKPRGIFWQLLDFRTAVPKHVNDVCEGVGRPIECELEVLRGS